MPKWGPRPKILVCGDRYWPEDDVDVLEGFIYALPPETIVITGACPTGVDKLVAKLCEFYNLDHRAYPANWSLHGRAAGPIRNERMLLEEQPDFVIYFHRNIDRSRGTRDCINQARRLGYIVFDGLALPSGETDHPNSAPADASQRGCSGL